MVLISRQWNNNALFTGSQLRFRRSGGFWHRCWYEYTFLTLFSSFQQRGNLHERRVTAETRERADHGRETDTLFFLCQEKGKIIISGTFFCQTSHVFCQAVASGSEAISSVFLMSLPCVQFYFHRFIPVSPRCDKQMITAGHQHVIVLYYVSLWFFSTLLAVHMAQIA